MHKSLALASAIFALHALPAAAATRIPTASAAVKALVARTFASGAGEIDEPEAIERGILTIGSLAGGQRRTVTVDFPAGARSFEVQAGKPSWRALPPGKGGPALDAAATVARAKDMSLEIAAKALKQAGLHPKDAVLALATVEQARAQAKGLKLPKAPRRAQTTATGSRTAKKKAFGRRGR